MKELENLLLSILERGWSPFGIDWDTIAYLGLDIKKMNIHLRYTFIDEEGDEVSLPFVKSIRDLVSLESGFWQFVCKNKLISDKVDMQDYIEDSYWFRRCPFDTNWVFRIIQSSIHSEEHLAKFLVDNIKLWN